MTRAPHAELQRYLDGDMTPEQVHALEERLRHDAGLRKELLILSGFDADLTGALQDAARAAREAARRSMAAIPADGELRAARQAAPACSAQRPGMPVRRWLWPTALAASLLLAVGGYLLHKARQADAGPQGAARGGVIARTAPLPAVRLESAEGRLVTLDGEVRIARADGNGPAVAATVGTEVHAGEVLVTASNAAARLAYADGSTLYLYRASVLALSRGEDGPCLDLRAGALDATMRNKLDGKRLRIVGDLLNADVIGTDFRLLANPQSRWLGVRSGKVIAARVADGQKVVLQDGEYVAVAPDRPFKCIDARACPVWKGICQQVAGTPYP